MNKTNQTATETARPWEANKWATGIEISGDHQTVCIFHDLNKAEANAALIVEAVNEHAALLAVAVAARRVSAMHSDAMFICGKDDQEQVDTKLNALLVTIAALNAIQKDNQ